MTEYIRNKIHNIGLVIDEIKEFPQTYKSILKEAYGDGTLQFILRRKLNNLCKDGDICKSSIPGTRFGKAIFYHIPKDYHILVEAGRTGSNVYCFFNFKKINRFYIEVDEYWELIKGVWMKKSNKRFFEGNVLKWI